MANNPVREKLSHPVIDADGHWAELYPVFFDYIREVSGNAVLEKFRSSYSRRVAPWYEASAKDRNAGRMPRPPYWGVPTSADRMAGLIPKLYRSNLDKWGIDVSVLYPTVGLGLLTLRDLALQSAVIRAYNVMASDLFRSHSDRIIPVGVVALNDPQEAIAQLEHAHALGLRQVVTAGSITRTMEADAAWQPDPAKRRIYIDGLGLDSPYDYEPVWNKFEELKITVTPHGGSMGWSDRNSPTNFVANHLGHFAQSHHLFARSLVLGGVTQRHPNLIFGFLEGGIGWACNLYSDLKEHWEKRNRGFMDANLKPTNFDRKTFRAELEKWAVEERRVADNIDDILEKNLYQLDCDVSVETLTERDKSSDDFDRVQIGSKAELRSLFSKNFFFGCEADDPMTSIAFNPKMRLNLKPVLGSDISHFDVVDASEVLGEAYELVEHELINEDNFRDFVYANAVKMFAGMNQDFFKGTILENDVKRELGGAKGRN